MKSLINMLKKDENAFSMSRVLALYSVVQWAVVTLYLAFLRLEWKHYDTLTYVTFGYVVVVLCKQSFQNGVISVKVGDNDATRNPSK